MWRSIEYERLLRRIDIEYRKTARQKLLKTQGKADIADNPPYLPDAILNGSS